MTYRGQPVAHQYGDHLGGSGLLRHGLVYAAINLGVCRVLRSSEGRVCASGWTAVEVSVCNLLLLRRRFFGVGYEALQSFLES